MTLIVQTAHISYPGPARFDVSRKSGHSAFAPSLSLLKAAHPRLGGTMPWRDYAEAYRGRARVFTGRCLVRCSFAEYKRFVELAWKRRATRRYDAEWLILTRLLFDHRWARDNSGRWV